MMPNDHNPGSDPYSACETEVKGLQDKDKGLFGNLRYTYLTNE